MAELRMGTCSWKFPSWEGLVYSAPKDIDYLAEYAGRYNTVEVDQWFWSLFGEESIGLPDPADVDAYRGAVPEGFRFTIKVPNSITLTHFYKKEKADPLKTNDSFLDPSLFETFLSRIEPLRDMLGPLMFQFEYLNRQKMASQDRFQEQFEGFVRQLPTNLQYAVEIRNPNYLNGSYLQFLDRSGLSPVLLQGYYMPSVLDLYKTWRSFLFGLDVVVVRLHGPDRQGIEKQTGKRWDQIVAPRDEELGSVADMVRELLDHDVDVYLNVNNHYEGSAPLTIERIGKLM